MAKTILVLAANPKNTSPLRLDQEVREIDSGLQRARRREEFVLVQKWATRPKDVRRAMLDYRPNIVHFCGHGTGEEGLVFEDENGQVKLVDADALSEFFGLFSEIECVVLNACYSEVQSEAIAKHIPYVIGMRRSISDVAAIEFAVAFYDALGAGESYEFAHRIACNALKWAGLPEHDIPVLIKRERFSFASSTEQNTSLKPRWPKYFKPYKRFVGRESVLMEIMEVLADPEGRWLVGIDGMGGIGKTAIASEVTIRCLENNLFQHVVWEQSSKTPHGSSFWRRISYDSVLISIAWQLGVPLTREGDLLDRERQVLNLLREQKTLIVLDNMETALESQDEIGQRLLPFLNPSKVLMTSRFRFNEIYAVHLPGLSEEEGIEFLQAEANDRGIHKIQKARPDDLRSAVRFVGGSPLALKFIVGQLGHLPLRAILRRLKETDAAHISSSRADEYLLLYKNIFLPSWQLLSDDSRKLLISIALLSPDAGGSLDAIKFISNLPEPTLLRCINELWSLSFVEVSEASTLEETFYYLHPLTQNFVLADIVNAI